MVRHYDTLLEPDSFDIYELANPERAWLTLAMSSTLAGNLTVLGSVANLIVIQQARRKVRIGFWEYFRVGAPLGSG